MRADLKVEEDHAVDFSKFLQLKYYADLLKRRYLYFIIPFVTIAISGSTFVMLLPALYLSEGKVLIETQQIPSELVRPTVTTLGSERIQVLQQRLMTRDNIMAIAEKFKLFANRRSVLSSTELVDLVRERTYIKPLELSTRPTQPDRATIAFTIGFEHEQPVIAMKVANEFITLILNEDLRNRTNRATDTTKFLAREQKRLQTDLAATESQLAEIRRSRAEIAAGSANAQSLAERTNIQLTTLRAELLSRAAQFSPQHPEMQAINRKIAALEKLTVQSNQAIEAENGLEGLLRQQVAIQKNLEEVTQKLSTARLGEALERDQQAEKLEVIEQPTMPQDPTKPKRGKLLALVLGLAVMAGAGLGFATESLDTTIRSQADLSGLIESYLIVPIPLITTSTDEAKRRIKLYRTIGIVAALVLVVIAAGYFLLPPLDILLEQAKITIPRYFNK